MIKSHDYAVQILWSEEEQAYIAAPFELPGCLADGQTPEEALANLRVIIEEWIEVAKQEGRTVPVPASAEDIRRETEEQNEKQNEILRQQIQAAVQQIVARMVGEVPLRSVYQRVYRSWCSPAEMEPVSFGRGVAAPPSRRGQ